MCHTQTTQTSEHNDQLLETVRYIVQPHRIKSYSYSVEWQQ